MAEVTKILYDVTDAIEKLRKLDKETKKTGKNSQKSFDKLGDKIDGFAGQLGKVDGRLGNLVGSFGKVARVAGPAGVAIGVVGAAAAGLAASIINVPELLRDATAELERFVRTRERARQGRDVTADLESSRTFAQLQQRDFELRARRSQITQRQVANAAEQEIARTRLQAATDSFKKIEAALKASVDRRKSILDDLKEDEAAGIVGEETQGKAAGRGTVDLIARAEQEALQGNTVLAKELLDAAKERAKELGNHVFFTSKIADAEAQIKAQLEEQVESEDDQIAKLKEQLKLALQIKEARAADLQGLQTEQAGLTRDKALLESRANDINRAKELDNASTQAVKGLTDMDTAARIAAENLKKILSPTAGETATATTDRLQALAPGGRTQRDVLDNSRVLRDIAQQVNRAVQTIATSGDRAAVDQAIALLNRAADRTDALRDSQPGRVLSTQNETNLQRIETAIEQGFRAGRGRAQLNLGSRDTGLTDPQEIGRAIGERAGQDLKNVLESRLPDAPEPNQGATARPVESTINVTANVRGGIIDAETTRTITDLIRKELRKQTTERASNIA